MIRPFQYRKLTREDVYRSHLFEAVASRRGLGGDKRICVLPQMAISVWMPMRPIVSDQVCNSLGSRVSSDQMRARQLTALSTKLMSMISCTAKTISPMRSGHQSQILEPGDTEAQPYDSLRNIRLSLPFSLASTRRLHILSRYGISRTTTRRYPSVGRR